jgi:hypothetical protein
MARTGKMARKARGVSEASRALRVQKVLQENLGLPANLVRKARKASRGPKAPAALKAFKGLQAKRAPKV